MDDSEIAELLKYQRMLKQGTYRAIDIVKKDWLERDDNDNLFMEMYLKNQVPFFSAYTKQNIKSICKVLKTVSFEKEEVIFKIGDPSNKCFVIVEGEIGIYFD